MEIAFDESELRRRLEPIPFWKQLVFLLAICQRLIPSFQAFAKEAGVSGEKELRRLIDKAWAALLAGIWNAEFSSDMAQAEKLAPDTEDFESILVSSALDAAIAISFLMKAFTENQTGSIVEAAGLIRDSVDMYIQELENLDPGDPSLEKKILTHELMQKELKRQREDLSFLTALDNDINLSIAAVEERWFGLEESCLGLMKA